MAVASGEAALSALRSLLKEDQVPAATILHRPYLPDGLAASADPVRMDPSTLIGGYGAESRYLLSGEDPELRYALTEPPAVVFGDRPSIKADLMEAYVKSSMDLTMQGGTTSGVVYPLAVCELATGFRFRNVGGASAGAIAAAFTAAAELGRSESMRQAALGPAGGAVSGSGISSGGSVNDAPNSSSEMPRIRRGFTGINDIIGWLSQTRLEDLDTEDFRLAQLFRPSVASHRLFRVAVAVMRRRFFALPLILLLAFGSITKVLAGVVAVGTVMLTGLLAHRLAETPKPFWAVVLDGSLAALVWVGLVVGATLVLQRLLAKQSSARFLAAHAPWTERLLLVTSRRVPPEAPVIQRAVPVVVLALVAVFGWWRIWHLAAAILVGLAGILVLSVILLLASAKLVSTLKSRSFGLISGATPQRERTPVDRLAGLPAATVEQSLVPWLNACLSQLSGLSERPGLSETSVLRFGHLWAGLDYEDTRTREDPDQLRHLRELATDKSRRRINLELMTTDVSRQRPYRFPLDPSDEEVSKTPTGARLNPSKLWVCLDELREAESSIFSEAVLTALAEGPCRELDDRSGKRRILHVLPEPWDLPVIVAVRLSLALPGLFQAVPMYRIVPRATIVDDFGRTVVETTSGTALSAFDDADVAEEVWFSDGGITSNFPVHFFDSPLPRWPTVSLNLGKHPDTAPHQDVSLPQDWDPAAAMNASITDSALSFAGSIFTTARTWRDRMQSAMPGYRNRIAQVRTWPEEGGTNLFMPRELIASMALRGALAGARLRTRFSTESHWDRFRWLRLRGAMSNIETLRGSIGERRGFYADIFSGRAWLEEQKASFCDESAGVVREWYEPEEGFWPLAPRLLNTFVDGYRPPEEGPNQMKGDLPRPEPELRQVPRE